MKINSVKVNFILNTTRMLLGMIFILLTTPYVTRILGAESLGKVEYVNSIITYFVLFTALGIPNYGLREVARCRENKYKLSKVVIELGIILFVTTIAGYIILLIFLYNTKLLELKNLVILMSLNLIFTNIGFEWFYQGIENQLYITIRYIILRIISLILLFLIVKNSNDYLKYGIILVLMNSGSNILNFINLRKYISFREIKIKNIEVLKHIKPILIIFSASIATSIYLQLDIVMIGNINKTRVAFYTVPNKIIRIVLTLVTALGQVLLPRITNCLEKKETEKYKRYLEISLNYIYMISIPAVVGIIVLSPKLIIFFAGDEFQKSILLLQILSILIFVIGISYFISYQILYPLKKEKYHTYTVIIVAIINFIFNKIMIPKYLELGAVIGTLLAEGIAMILLFIFSFKYLKDVKFFEINKGKYILSSFIVGIILIILDNLKLNLIFKFLIQILLGGSCYILILFVLRENMICTGYQNIKKYLKKEKMHGKM